LLMPGASGSSADAAQIRIWRLQSAKYLLKIHKFSGAIL
jgi:hypothetical protein